MSPCQDNHYRRPYGALRGQRRQWLQEVAAGSRTCAKRQRPSRRSTRTMWCKATHCIELRRRRMEDVRPKVASEISIEGKPRRATGGTRRKPVGRPILLDRYALAHVRKFQKCMRFKPNQMQADGKMLTPVPVKPRATVCADFVGPLPRSKCC